MSELILVLDFGGQYKELIARTVRGFNVYSEIKQGHLTAEQIRELAPIGIILSGGPNSVYMDNAPKCDPEIFELGIPVLGICYGMQLMCHMLGGEVAPCEVSEYGKIDASIKEETLLFSGVKRDISVLMSHTDCVRELPTGFISTVDTDNCVNAAFENAAKGLYGVQFHPEVNLTERGQDIIKNFLINICGASADYLLDDYLENQIVAIRQKVGDEKVLLGLSGGVDSSVCASLLSKAIPGQLFCIFVDHGFMRLNEGDEIEKCFSNKDLHFIRVNAQERFLEKVKGVVDPEKKRKIIGEEFVRVFEEEAAKLGNIKFLAQGTIYPDIIESGGETGAVIKNHHNVGGLPKDRSFVEIVEPLNGLFKDEVRKVGIKLDVPRNLVERQPFPGPGLAIRIMGEITKEKLEILKFADAIFCEEVSKQSDKPEQYFAVFTDVHTVGVKGDDRTYDYAIALRAVRTNDFMTCEYANISHEVLGRVSSRIVNEVKGVNRVLYDITSKPPATVEWE